MALARALINQPEVLLLDEPLGALDLKLRQQMQSELKALQRKVGITFVYVTHDQEEALGMSDRLAVFNHGRIEQIGTPEAIYEHPATAFVAGFVGASNIVDAASAERLIGRAQPFALRPERIRLGDGAADHAVEGTVVERPVSRRQHPDRGRARRPAGPDRRPAERPAGPAPARARQPGPAVAGRGAPCSRWTAARAR